MVCNKGIIDTPCFHLAKVYDGLEKLDRYNEVTTPHIPIGNSTSQLFANVYMNPFDHFAKEVLGAKFYLRYTDDFILLHDDRRALEEFLPQIQTFLKAELNLELHPGKTAFRKLNQGIDFLGYVVFTKHIKLRERTKNRMMKKLQQDVPSKPQMSSYLGLLSHCEGYELGQQIRRVYLGHEKK